MREKEHLYCTAEVKRRDIEDDLCGKKVYKGEYCKKHYKKLKVTNT